MDHHRKAEVTGRRTLLNGWVTAAARSWRHGLQPNGGHTSNAMVFPTVSTAASPTCRNPVVDGGGGGSTTTEERLQQQRHRDHRLNVLWYGGEDSQQQQQQQQLHAPPPPTVLFESQDHRYQSTDDWEKRPLRRQRPRKCRRQRSRRGRGGRRNERPELPAVPVVWAAVLLAAYASAMAALYYVYGATVGGGWMWFKGIAGPSRWLSRRLSPTWYYAVQASCAVVVGCVWWSSQHGHRGRQRRRLCCYLLLALFFAAIFPSVPLVDNVFGGGGITTAENSTVRGRQHKQPDGYHSITGGGDFDDNRPLAMYEGLWQVTFFVLVAYCLVLPTGIDDENDGNDVTVVRDERNNDARNADGINHDAVTTAVLLFSTLVSIGHTSLNAYTAYRRWYFRQRHNNSDPAAVQQFIANVMVLTCINLIGWLLRQSMIRDRAEILGHHDGGKRDGNGERVRFALRQQVNKLNLLLKSLLSRRVFSEMKYDIVIDAARSRSNVTYNSNDEDYQNDAHLQRLRQELQLHASPQLPRMYMKEYSDVSVVCASVTGFWENVSEFPFHNEINSQHSRQLTELIDKLMVDLFSKLARRNGCITTRLLGNRIFFVAGLPAEELYGFDDDECNNAAKQLTDDGGEHANNAVQLGLDLIDTVNMAAHHLSRRRCNHKINLGVRVGVHSGKVTCGVLGFTGTTGIRSDLGSRWQYEVWGRDVIVASDVESNGRPGWVHATRATVDQITKSRVSRRNHPLPKDVVRNKTVNCNTDSSNNVHDYTFKRGNNNDQMDTYFVVPNTSMHSNTEVNGNLSRNRVDTHDNDGINNYYGENIESLILQSVERQLHLEDIRQQYTMDLMSETEAASVPLLPPNTTTAVSSETPMIPTAVPGTTMKMIMNRHRRSRYEQEPLQTATTKLNTSSLTTMKHRDRWEVDVFGDYNGDDHDKIRRKSDDEDLFRLAKSQLLLLCVIITLFVVNVTTMPWTMLLGITFITPFVVTAGGLIYVMALLIDWIPRPRFCSTAYSAAIVADDEEYYQHYDCDNNDSDSSNTNADSSGCLRHLFVCNRPSNNCSLFSWLSKPFKWGTNTTMTNRNALDDSDSQRRCTAKWYHCCRCRDHFGWFTWCLDNDETSSWVSSDDSDIESRLGFRNENAIIMAATAGIFPPQQQNRLQHTKTNNINNNHNTGRLHHRRRQLRRKYQDEERHTWFFWLAACSEMFVILLVCLLALLNAFTCEPIAVTSTNAVYDQLLTINNGSSCLNTTRIQQLQSPLVCQWPQYVVLTCCLACLSIAIAFPIYYGSLPTLRWKIGTLVVMTCVFAVAFVHFTHKHVFIAASISSYTPTCYMEVDNFHNHQTINTTLKNIDHSATNVTYRRDLYQEDQQQSKLQDKKQQLAAGLDTAITTVYVMIFAAAMLAYFTYTHYLQNRRAYCKINIDRIVRRLNVLRTAHRRTLHAVMPDYVAHSLRNSCINNASDADDLREETRQRKNNVSTDIRLIPQDILGREQITSHPSSPFYHCSYQTVVVMFATIVKQDVPLVTPIPDCNTNDQQLSIFLDTFVEFDRLLDDQKFQGLVDKIKMIGTETYMAAVGLQYSHKPDHQLLMLLNEMKQRNKESCHYNDRDKKNNINSCIGNEVSVVSNLENVYELHNMISANYVIFALDFVRDMRRALHRRQAAVVTPVGYSHNSQPTQFTLQVGVNVGPVVAGLIGCNNGLGKRPQFDIWGNTVNIAKQMDVTGIPGSTHVTHRVVDALNSIKDPVYAFDELLTITKDNRSTYIVRENVDRDEDHRLVQQFNNYHQPQPLYRQTGMVHKNPNNSLELDRHQQQQCNHPAVVRSPYNAHRTMTQQLEHDQSSLNAVPIVTVHQQHSYYNAMVQQELRQKHSAPQKTPPSPPPRSPLSANVRRTPLTNYPLLQHQHSGERDRHQDNRQRSRGIHQLSNGNRQQQNRHASDATTASVVTYALPLQKQQQQQQQSSNNSNSRQSPNSCCAPASRGLGVIFGGEPTKQPAVSTHRVSPPQPTVADVNSSNNRPTARDETAATHENRQQLQQKPCRPTVLDLVNTTAVSSKRFDADRPLPAPPRSSDTAAGRQRHRDDPRRRRRQQQNQLPTAAAGNRQEVQKRVRSTAGNSDRCQTAAAAAAAWPSMSSSFRSPVSASSLASVSSLSSSGSTDAGNTTTSNNNYNTTTTASSPSSSSSSSSSSSDDSFGRTEDDVGDRVDTEDFDTAASSAAVSPVHNRYNHRQQQQQHLLLLRQWSPSTTANSSPVRRSSSFRSPLSTNTAAVASSSSLQSPSPVVMVGGHTVAGFGGTQSLNRRRLRPVNVTAAAASGGNSSGRRRRRRQQQNNNATSSGQSTTPLSAVVVPAVDIVSSTTEKYDSPPLSPWKKQQHQRRQVTTVTKDPGTTGGATATGPDFTDEIRRILLLDHHRGNVRQQQQDDAFQGEERHDALKQRIADNVVKPSSYSPEQQQRRAVTTSTTNLNSDIGNENIRRSENNGSNDDVDPSATTTATTVNTSSSSFEERERQMTEQVKRQQAEVRRILQAHKNNVAAIIRGTAGTATDTAEAILHGRRRLRIAADSSEWSDDDESVEPSSLLDDGHREPQRAGSVDDGGSIVTAAGDDGDGYTTGGDGDGYTTTGYTTDDAAATGYTTDDAAVDKETDTGLSVTRARQLDNLSTINDTGLTDAEAALSDVNSMIDFNDCNERTRCGSRRQSSLSGSSVCPYASDSFYEDDDDYNDDDELIFQGYNRFNANNEKLEFREEEDDKGRRYNFQRFLQQPEQQSSPSPLDGVCTNNSKRLYTPQQQASQHLTSSQNNDTTVGVNQRHVTSDSSTVATTTMKTSSATNTTPIEDNTINNVSFTTTTTTTATTTTATTTTTTITTTPTTTAATTTTTTTATTTTITTINKYTEADNLPPSTNVKIKDN